MMSDRIFAARMMGLRGDLGIDLAADPADGGYLVKVPGGARRFAASIAPGGADETLRPDLAGPRGSLHSGFTQAGDGASTRAVEDELRETVKVSQFSAGGVSDSAALQRAYAYLASDANGGVIELDRRNYNTPYVFDALALAELSTAGTNPITLRGKGRASPIKVASACVNFLTFNGAWSALEDLMILDPAGLCSGAYILTKPTTGQPGLERWVSRVKGIGPGSGSTASLLVNNGGQKLRVSDLDGQNMQGVFWNQGGGVDSQLELLYGLGIKYGVRLDSNPTYGHAENLKVSRSTLLATQAGGIGIWVTDSLGCAFNDVLADQLGNGGIGVYMDGTSGQGSTMTEFNTCYLGSAPGGAALKSRGNNQNMHMNGGGIGQGAYAAGDLNMIDMDGAANFLFEGVNMNLPLSNANKIATFANSYGTISHTCKNWDLAVNRSTETACAIHWEVYEPNAVPASAGRSPTSYYPNVDMTAWTPTITTVNGAITTLGPLDCAYVRRGRIVEGRAKVPIQTNGTGGGVVALTPPVPIRAGVAGTGSGREDGVSGRALQVKAAGNSISIANYDNTYPGANGAVLVITFSYEAA